MFAQLELVNYPFVNVSVNSDVCSFFPHWWKRPPFPGSNTVSSIAHFWANGITPFLFLIVLQSFLLFPTPNSE